MYAYLYIYIYIYIHTYTYTYMCIHMNKPIIHIKPTTTTINTHTHIKKHTAIKQVLPVASVHRHRPRARPGDPQLIFMHIYTNYLEYIIHYVD